MTIRNEKQVYARLKAKWPEAHWQRFETSIGSGAPDTNMCHPRYGEVWFENKIARVTRGRPSDQRSDGDRITVNLRPKQRLWIDKRVDAGGSVYIAWAFGDIVYLTHGINLMALDNKDYLNNWLVASTVLGDFTLEDA